MYYYVFLVPVQYWTVLRDSEFILKNGLDEGIAVSGTEEPHQLEEDARYLLAQDENKELINLLADASLSLIHADELQLVRRVGVGGFGEVKRTRKKKSFSSSTPVSRFIKQTGMERLLQ